MEIATFEALQILLFLIPGFISIAIFNACVYRKKQKPFDQIVFAATFCMFDYTVYISIFNKTPVSLTVNNSQVIYNYEVISFWILIGVSVVTPLLFAFCVHNDFPLRVLRRLGITRNTLRDSVWLDVFLNKQRHIIINFKNGRRIYGWPMHYSNNPKSSYIYLYKPSWISDGKFIDLDIDGILITPEQEIETIEFLKQ